MEVELDRVGGAPTWPDTAASSFVVLAEAASQLERDLIETWIRRDGPDDGSVELIWIPPSRRRKL